MVLLCCLTKFLALLKERKDLSVKRVVLYFVLFMFSDGTYIVFFKDLTLKIEIPFPTFSLQMIIPQNVWQIDKTDNLLCNIGLLKTKLILY